jgi:penicillin-binding protein 1A
MLANGGKQVRPTLIDRIQDRWGRTVWRHDERPCEGCKAQVWQGQAEPEIVDDRKPMMDPHTAYQMTSMLEGVVQRGTATVIKQKLPGVPLAGKTGTTNDSKDVWFVGYSPDLVVGVFVGYDTPKPMGKAATGGAITAPIFAHFMKLALADKKPVPFRQPPGIKLVRVNPKTGLRANRSWRRSNHSKNLTTPTRSSATKALVAKPRAMRQAYGALPPVPASSGNRSAVWQLGYLARCQCLDR